MKKNDTVYVLDEYNWVEGTVKIEPKESSKTVLVELTSRGFMRKRQKRVPVDKIATPDESVCVVWELWKGTNGRGGYRVERELYPNIRVPACKVSHSAVGNSGRITEEQKP